MCAHRNQLAALKDLIHFTLVGEATNNGGKLYHFYTLQAKEYENKHNNNDRHQNYDKQARAVN